MQIEQYKDNPMYKALIELNERMQKENLPQIELNVIGGFAMMTHELRSPDGFTDIDYVGNDLPKKVAELSDEIGIKYGLGRGWINNDVLLSGSTLEDMEFSTGKLHFHEAFALEGIKVNILDKADLLRMKVIAIDTSLSGVELGDGDFTRYKDFNDIIALKNDLKMSNIDIREMMGEQLLNDHTISAIKAFEMGGIEHVDKVIDEVRREGSFDNIYRDVLAAERAANAPGGSAVYSRSSFLDDVLNSAIERSRLSKMEKDAPPDKNSEKDAR